MATSWGIDPLKDGSGNVTIGTTAADFRQIQGGLYSPGVISGGVVTRSSSAMTYTVSGGVAAYPIITSGVPQTVLGPIPSGVLTTTAATSGTRVDIVYAQQRTVAVEGDPNIIIAIGTSLPERAVMLDSFIVSTTTTNTESLAATADIKYSIPYGAPRGTPWFSQRSTFNGTFNATKTRAANGVFYMPSDRNVTFNLSTSLNSSGAVGFDNSKYCEAAFALYIDNVWRFTWTTGGLHQAMQDYNWEESGILLEGSHTVWVDRWKSAGGTSALPYQRYGTGNLGLLFEIRDVGPTS
jgi:hypothetical protein